MRLIVDTHVVIWWLLDDKALGRIGRDVIEAADTQIVVSDVAIWEIAIKHGLGKLTFNPDAVDRAINEEGFDRLAINLNHILRVGRLPLHHRDPFDRMTIAQAQAEGCLVMTDDADFARYGIDVVPCR